MKLTMKNQYSFQEAMGYEDDPECMTPSEVIDQLEHWRVAISYLVDEGTKIQFSSELIQIESFLSNLVESRKVVYEEPLQEYEFTVVFEYNLPINVLAKDEGDAVLLAIKRVKEQGQAFESAKTWANTLIYDDDGDEVYDMFNDNSMF